MIGFVPPFLGIYAIGALIWKWFVEEERNMKDSVLYGRIDKLIEVLHEGARAAHEDGHPSLAPFCAALGKARAYTADAKSAALDKEAQDVAAMEASNKERREAEQEARAAAAVKRRELQDRIDEIGRALGILRRKQALLEDSLSFFGNTGPVVPVGKKADVEAARAVIAHVDRLREAVSEIVDERKSLVESETALRNELAELDRM